MSINGFTLVDSHVHLLPGRLGEKVRAFFDAGVGSRSPLAYPNNHPEVVSMLSAEGVDAVWSLPYAHKPGVAIGLNEASALTATQFVRSPVQVIGGATVHPGDDEPLEIVTDAVDALGLRVLKLHCSVGNFSVNDVRLAPVMSFAAQRRLPVVIHLGHNVNGRTEEDELPVIGELADQYPDMPLILAHCGHHSARAAMELMDNHPSLYADITPVVTEHPDITAEHVEKFADRILFGSDAPNTALSVTDGVRWLEAMNLDESIFGAVLGGNAMRLTARVLFF